MRMPLFLAVAWLLVRSAAGEGPCIFWASDPALPDETVLLLGDSLGGDAVVEMACRDASNPVSMEWTGIQPLQSSPQSIKAAVPADWPLGVYACRVRVADAVSNDLSINAPEAWWWNGDGGEFATPGGWLRVFGKSLCFGGSSDARLRSSDGRVVELKAIQADGYALRFAIPRDLESGDYALSVSNGLPGEASWRDAGAIAIREIAPWKDDLFNVKDYGPRPEDALRIALEKAALNGGGIVYLPRGRYPVAGSLSIPPNTVLKGESMDLTSLYWPDFDKLPEELIAGANYGIESLSLYCQNHRTVVADRAASQRFFLRQVRIRANCYFMIEEIGRPFRGRHGPPSHTECNAAVLLRGKNFEVSDCDIYASNYAVRVMNAKAGVVARNRLRYGGRGYSIENTDRLIFEENFISGANLLAIGNDITTFWSTYCQHIYFARNRLRQMYGADREMMTLDGGGGAYFGAASAVDGTRLTLASDPVFRDYLPTPRTDWTGAAVQILDGKGAGQYRFVVSHSGRECEVDRPWAVEPDSASRLSISQFRGRNLFIGNTFEDGGAVQLYGAAHDSIVAGNRGTRMDGFYVWGLNPHGWGKQPSWGCQFLDNEILVGNGYGHRSASFGTIGDDEPRAGACPMVRGAIFRRNVLHNNASIEIGDLTEDAIVEHCTVRDNEVGIRVRSGFETVLLRDNVFENVAQPEIFQRNR